MGNKKYSFQCVLYKKIKYMKNKILLYHMDILLSLFTSGMPELCSPVVEEAGGRHHQHLLHQHRPSYRALQNA